MRSEAERAEGEAFADYCRNAKPPITADDPARCATAVASFSAGWKAGYACDDMPDDLKQIQDLLAHAFIGKSTTVVGKGLVERWEATIAAQAEAIRLLREACQRAADLSSSLRQFNVAAILCDALAATKEPSDA